jgi:hypothetical protein
MNKFRELCDLALCVACIALPFVLYFAFVMKPWKELKMSEMLECMLILGALLVLPIGFIYGLLVSAETSKMWYNCFLTGENDDC